MNFEKKLGKKLPLNGLSLSSVKQVYDIIYNDFHYCTMFTFA